MFFFPSPSSSQSLSSGYRWPAYGVERAPCAFHNFLVPSSTQFFTWRKITSMNIRRLMERIVLAFALEHFRVKIRNLPFGLTPLVSIKYTTLIQNPDTLMSKTFCQTISLNFWFYLCKTGWNQNKNKNVQTLWYVRWTCLCPLSALV